MKKSIFGNPVKPGVNVAIRELEEELDTFEAKAVGELSGSSTRIKGKIRLQIVRECRTTLRLIASRYRSG